MALTARETPGKFGMKHKTQWVQNIHFFLRHPDSEGYFLSFSCPSHHPRSRGWRRCNSHSTLSALQVLCRDVIRHLSGVPVPSCGVTTVTPVQRGQGELSTACPELLAALCPGTMLSQSGWRQRSHRAPTHCPDPVTLWASPGQLQPLSAAMRGSRLCSVSHVPHPPGDRLAASRDSRAVCAPLGTGGAGSGLGSHVPLQRSRAPGSPREERGSVGRDRALAGPG